MAAAYGATIMLRKCRQNANQVVRARNDPYDSKVSSQMSKCS